MTDLVDKIEALAAETAYSGVVSVTAGHDTLLSRAYGLAHRGHEIANTIDTRFGLASGTKGFTAVVIASLVEDGRLTFDTTARSLLGDDLPLIDDAVSIDHLLSHRSGIGDYLEEDTDLDRNAYVLALLAERARGLPFEQLVQERVCRPAGMTDTAFSRSDQLPARTATGYLLVDGGWRSNVFHLPLVGSGDGGVYSTVADLHAFWSALLGGQIIAPTLVTDLVTTCSTLDDPARRYGRGFWLRPRADLINLEGCDAGVSFYSLHDRSRDLTCTVLSNTTDGAWPIARLLVEELKLT